MMTESISSGKFITVEGIDGCGKTTQAEFIVDGLADAGLSAKLVREPGGDPISLMDLGLLQIDTRIQL